MNTTARKNAEDLLYTIMKRGGMSYEVSQAAAYLVAIDTADNIIANASRENHIMDLWDKYGPAVEEETNV